MSKPKQYLSHNSTWTSREFLLFSFSFHIWKLITTCWLRLIMASLEATRPLYHLAYDSTLLVFVIKVILNKLNLNSMKFILNFCIKGFNTCLLWSNSLIHRVNSKMSNFLLRVVLECFSFDLENGTHLKLNNHLYQAECQKQNLLHLPMLKLIPVPLGDRLYPPVLPEYQMSTTAPGTGLQRLSSTRPRRITAFSLSTSSVSGASWCLEPT